MRAETILRQHLSKTVKLTDEEFAYVFKHFQPLTFKKDEMLISAGEKVDREYFVVSGCLKTYLINSAGKMFILQFATPTWWASDYHGLYYDIKATVNVDCVWDAQVLCLGAADREKMCKELRKVEWFFRWRTNKGYVALQERLLSFMNNDARHRYEEFARIHPDLRETLPQQLIAAYLGVTRETLSRLKVMK